MIVVKRSMLTGNINYRLMDIDKDTYFKWRITREPVDLIFPHLSSEDQEYLVTGITIEELQDFKNNSNILVH